MPADSLTSQLHRIGPLAAACVVLALGLGTFALLKRIIPPPAKTASADHGRAVADPDRRAAGEPERVGGDRRWQRSARRRSGADPERSHPHSAAAGQLARRQAAVVRRQLKALNNRNQQHRGVPRPAPRRDPERRLRLRRSVQPKKTTDDPRRQSPPGAPRSRSTDARRADLRQRDHRRPVDLLARPSARTAREPTPVVIKSTSPANAGRPAATLPAASPETEAAAAGDADDKPVASGYADSRVPRRWRR